MTTVAPVGRRRGGRGAAVVRALTLLVLHTPLVHTLLDRAVCELRFTGRHSGRTVTLPVMYAGQGGDLVVLVGRAAGKTWWHNFSRPHVVHVRRARRWYEGIGRTVTAGADARPTAVDTYRARFPRVRIKDADPFVVIVMRSEEQSRRFREGRRP
jgi:hypothetical protein